MTNRKQRGRLGERGQALAEFALIMPVLFLCVAGIIEFGRGWNIKQAVTDASREGARYAVIADATITPAIVQSKVEERLALAGITTSTVDVPAGSFHVGGGTITITVSTQYRMGFVGALLAWSGASSTITITGKTTMRNE